MLNLIEHLMSLLQRVCKTLGGFGLAVTIPTLVFGQSGYIPQGGEYFPAGSLAGDQVNAAISLTTNGGYLVWQDNITDGDGYGISARRLDSSLSPAFSNFRVNVQGADDQENPQVTLLKNGGAAFVWQGGKQSFQHIYGNFLNSGGTLIYTNNDIMVSTDTNHFQVNPVIATLAGGNVVVAYGSYGQDNVDGLQGVYAQMLTQTGTKTNGEFQVNQFTPFNQRTPAIAAFPNGGFIIVWASERERSQVNVDGSGNLIGGRDSVDIYGRFFNANGSAAGNEFLINTSSNVCADPTVATASDGTFIVAWGEKDTVVLNNSWDVFARQFSGAGVGGAVLRLNTQQYGDQYGPKISSLGTSYLAVWTSLGQDGSREGVYGQVLNGDGSHAGGEFRVNTTILNSQMFPAVASDGAGRFLAVWSSYVGGLNSLDLNAQRYVTASQPLSPPGAPVINALASYLLSVSWPPLLGFSVDHWNLYVDGSSAPIMTTNTFWQNEGVNDTTNDYNPGSAHTFQLAYVLTDGRQSPLSATATGSTWQSTRHGYDLPYDWETLYYGTNSANWKNSGYQLAPGVTVGMVFDWGANPLDPTTWLKQSISSTPEGLFLSWNTRVGGIYQVQTCTDLVNWTNLGGPRFAAGTTDSLYLGTANHGYYRINRLVY